MNIVKTKSFELAISTHGDASSKNIALCLPGRLDSKDYANFTSHLNYLASKGYYAVSFDPPGTWDSPGNIDLFTTTNYINAVHELIEYFGNKPTLLLGHSRGGAVCSLSSNDPSITGVVLVMASYEAPSSPTNLVNGFQVSSRDMPPGDTKTVERKKFELPLNYFTEGQKHNPLAVLKKFTKPKLLFAGKNDKYYSLAEMQEIYESIPEPKMFHELNSDHDYRYHPEIIEEVNQVIGKFLAKYFS